MQKKYITHSIIEKKIKEIYSELIKNPSILGDNRFDILGGKSGEIIFKLSFHKYFKNEYDDLYNDISELISRMSGNGFVSGGISGLAGVLYSLMLVKEQYPDFEDINELFTQVEELVINAFYEFVSVKNYDYLHGSTGVVAIFINDEARYEKHIKYFVEKIYNEFCNKNDLEKFSKFNNANYSYEFKHGYSNSSFSHGISGLVIALAKAYNLGIEKDKIEKIFENLVEFYNKFEITEDNSTSVYTNYLPNANISTRMAWCVGDLGISIALWNIGQCLNNDKYKHRATRIFDKCSERKELKENLIFDSGFCHGMSGIAQMFNKIYALTNDEKYYTSTEFWITQTLSNDTFNDGFAGYKAWQADLGWQNEYSFLEGICGIGMVLIDFSNQDMNNSYLNRGFL